MKLAAGEIVEIGGEKAVVKKVSAIPTMLKRAGKYIPMVRVYWSVGKKRGHSDCVVEGDLEVVCG